MPNFSDYVSSFRKMLYAIMPAVNASADKKNARHAGASILKMVHRNGVNGMMDAIAEQQAIHAEKTSGYLTAEEIEAGKSGEFDVLDLRAWLSAISSPAVPAESIVSLTEDEASCLSVMTEDSVEKTFKGKNNLAHGLLMLASSALSGGWSKGQKVEDYILNTSDSSPVSQEEVRERLMNAMEGVPPTHMVRYHRTGGSILKAIAGSGMGGPVNPEVHLSATTGGGAGWKIQGNRRIVDLDDHRIIGAMAQAPHGVRHHFVARPWIASSRYSPLMMDPNRANTPARGPGSWPYEWRVFICDGVVTGISGYYPWAMNSDDMSKSMDMVQRVKAEAEKIIAECKEKGLRPAYYPVDHMSKEGATPEIAEALQAYEEMCPPGGFNCCIDFLETEIGPVFLEAGPPVTPMGLPGGGAHPIGFVATIPTPMTSVSFPRPFGVILSTPEEMSLDDLVGKEDAILIYPL